MSRVCEILNKKVQVWYQVSHSNRKTKKRFLPNLQSVTLYSDILNKFFKVRACTQALRTIDINGGFDAFLLSTSNLSLSGKAQKIKKMITMKTKQANKVSS